MNERQRRFASEYVVDVNAKAAAARAGYSGKHAGRHGQRLLRHREVAAEIARLQAERRARRQVTADRVLEEIARIAFADMRNFADWGPDGVTLREKGKLSEEDAAAIARVDPPRGNGKTGRLRLYDKHAALEALARHTGLFHPRRAMGPLDQRRAGEEARAMLLERLARLRKADDGSESA